jgi:tryptophan 7-halogenase
MDLHNRIEKIIIVGGGTTGWMAASYLAKALQGSVTITLIESDEIPTVGVGEATVPSMIDLFDYLEIPESQWMKQCNATFKMGIKFVNWAYPPSTTKNNTYYHVFGEAKECDNIPLIQYWLKKKLDGYEVPMANSCFHSPDLCDNYRSPKYLDGNLGVNYAYHFDAGLVAGFLTKWATNHGVVRVIDQISDVILDRTGAIGDLITKKGNTYTADLYLDCSGFRGLLINQALKEPFIPFSDNLLCDRAVAGPIIVEHNESNLRPYTTATALSAGWLWETPLYNRLGSGYVYSEQFLSPEEAEQEFRAFHGSAASEIKVRHIKMRVGRNQRAWVKNCISLGLANGFVEPLESTGIYFVHAALNQLIRYFPDKNMESALIDKFNKKIAYMIEDVRDFIVLHYCTTSREDTPFWKANKFDLKIPESLQALLELYRSGSPVNAPYTDDCGYNRNFDASFDRFLTNSNYLAILAGVNYLSNSAMPILNHKHKSIKKAELIFQSVHAKTEILLAELPSHYTYIKNLHKQ